MTAERLVDSDQLRREWSGRFSSLLVAADFLDEDDVMSVLAVFEDLLKVQTTAPAAPVDDDLPERTKLTEQFAAQSRMDGNLHNLVALKVHEQVHGGGEDAVCCVDCEPWAEAAVSAVGEEFDRLRGEVERLTRERDEAQLSYDNLSGFYTDLQQEVMHEREQLRLADDKCDQLHADAEELRQQLLDWAEVLVRGGGVVVPADIAWKLRQLAAPAVGSDTTAQAWQMDHESDFPPAHLSHLPVRPPVSSGGDTDTRAAHCGAMHAEYGECFLDPGVDEHEHGHESEIGRWTVVPAEQEGGKP